MSILTLDIGGTKIAAAIVSREGVAGPIHSVPTPATEGARAVLTACVAAARQAASDLSPGEKPELIGVSSAGVIDSDAGVVTHATDLIRGWAGTLLGAELTAALGAPAFCLNDVHAHALGEARHGAGRDAASLLLVAVGTGIGGAHVVEGRVLTGAHFAAGHVGHVAASEARGRPCSCGRSGHLEAIASGSGILAAYRALGGVADSGAQIADEAAGDGPMARTAAAVLATAGRATGRVIGSLLNVLDPTLVVLSGSVTRAGAVWFDPLVEGVGASALDALAATPIVHASTGAAAPHLGAAAFAREKA